MAVVKDQACTNGHTFLVSSTRDSPADPEYPVVVCPTCLTRWYGHRDGAESKPLDARLPAALRDAILLDQVESVFAILEDDLGFSRPARPNACLGISTGILIQPAEAARINARAQAGDFTPTHFVTGVDGFEIDDVRVGNKSMFIQSGSIQSEAFRVNVKATPDLVLRPGDDLGQAYLDIIAADTPALPLACSAFRWLTCPVEWDLVVMVTNVSTEPRRFAAWFLGRSPIRELTTAFRSTR